MKIATLACTLFVLLFSKYAFAASANELSKFVPDKIGDFTATAPATIEDKNEGSGEIHRVQRTYGSKNGVMCVIAIIEGPEVSNNIKSVFLREGIKTKIRTFDAIKMITDKNDPMAQSSIKIGNQCLLTVVVLNTKNLEAPIEVFDKLDLGGLAKLVGVGEKDNVDKSK